MLTYSDTDPKTPHKRKALRTDSSLSSENLTEVTMTLSSSSDLPSICQVNMAGGRTGLNLCMFKFYRLPVSGQKSI